MIIKKPVQFSEIWNHRKTAFEDMIKVVVDVSVGLLAIDAELHADLEEELIQHGSDGNDLWGANLHLSPTAETAYRIEFSALINIRPSTGNRSMMIENETIREQVDRIVHNLLN
jgi:hypothetical protein